MQPNYLKIARAVLAQLPQRAPAGDDPALWPATAPPATVTIVAAEPAEPAPQVKPARIDAGKRIDQREVNWGLTTTRRLAGNGFPPIPPTIPPTSILATPAFLCPVCGLRLVLAELRTMTRGRCHACWSGSVEATAQKAQGAAQAAKSDSSVTLHANAPERS